jgi:TonB family protein
MFQPFTRRPAPVPALLIISLLLASAAAAQDKKTRTGGPVQGIGPGEVGPHVAPQPRGPDGPFRQKDVTKKAVITYKPEPGFIEDVLSDHVDGVVRLRAVLNKSGEVTDISVIKPMPGGFTEKAVAAARQIKFRPAEKDGRPVSQYVVLEYSFVIFEDDEKVKSKAVILEQPRPEYTDEARARKVEGKVVLEVFLSKDGSVQVGDVVRGLPYGLTEKAREAAMKIRFKPAEDGGRPVSVVRKVEYVFSLN